jgi:hypothetical protein
MTLTTEDLLELGFKRRPQYSIGGNFFYPLSRGRALSVAGVGTTSESLMIDDNDGKEITDIISLHDHLFEGALTEEKINAFINLLADKDKPEYRGTPLKNADLIALGFEEIPHFTIGHQIFYRLGRRRLLQAGNIGDFNEMVTISTYDPNDEKNITNCIVVHNFDFDGFLTIEKVQALIDLIKDRSGKR